MPLSYPYATPSGSGGTKGYQGDLDALVFSVANGVTHGGVVTHSDLSQRSTRQGG